MMCSLCPVVVSLCPLEWIHTGLGALMCLVTRVPAILVAKLTFFSTRHRVYPGFSVYETPVIAQ